MDPLHARISQDEKKGFPNQQHQELDAKEGEALNCRYD
jgi:hypothetical protein